MKMKESPFISEFNDDEESFLFEDIFFRYLDYWRWFLVSVVLSLFFGYMYVRYAPVTYESVAKIKIIDE